MPAVHHASSDRDKVSADDIEVLVTGFGPFGRFTSNPSWLCTEELHGADLTHLRAASSAANGQRARRIRVQSIMTPVVYTHILDLVPRIHGNTPASPDAERWVDPRGPQPDHDTGRSAQGNGQAFPEGYRDLRIPVDQDGARRPFDIVVHVGVGSAGYIALETFAHKRGYNKPNARDRRAPVAEEGDAQANGSESRQQHALPTPSAAEMRELENLQASPGQANGSNGLFGFISGSKAASLAPLLGFGKGYEAFDDRETLDPGAVTKAVTFLKEECKFEHIRQSHDAGKYLCDFIYYCSLAERKRASAPTFVQFVHVPPLGLPYGSKDCTDIIKSLIWFLAQHVAQEEKT